MPQYEVKGKPLNDLKKQEVRQTHKKDGKKGEMPLCDIMQTLKSRMNKNQGGGGGGDSSLIY